MADINSTTRPETPKTYRGQVVYTFAYDVAYDTRRTSVLTLLGQTVTQFPAAGDKRSPQQEMFYRPQMITLPSQRRIGPTGPVQVVQTVKILPIGALSVTVRVPFEVSSLADLVTYHDLHFHDTIDGSAGTSSVPAEAMELARSVCKELAPYLIRPVSPLRQDESYTVFCIESPAKENDPFRAEEWLARNRRDVAALLTQESDPSLLSAQETEESTSHWLSYYHRDLCVVDWDAAVLMDDPQNFDETLHIIELSNVQLAELEAYDRLLDDTMERSYRDMTGPRMRRSTRVLTELREIRVDMARLSDELENITKFFGDWHLARLYHNLSVRFHLADWRRTIDEKTKTLDDLYQILKQDINNRWMLLLEIAVVLCFIIDLVLLVLPLVK